MNKKKWIVILVIISLIFLYSPIKNWITELMIPEKILVIVQRVDEHGINFLKEIKDKEKISEFESLFEDVEFIKDSYYYSENSDMVTHIRHKGGFVTHWFEIWFKEDGAIVLSGTTDEMELAKLDEEQVIKLKEIIYE